MIACCDLVHHFSCPQPTFPRPRPSQALTRQAHDPKNHDFLTSTFTQHESTLTQHQYRALSTSTHHNPPHNSHRSTRFPCCAIPRSHSQNSAGPSGAMERTFSHHGLLDTFLSTTFHMLARTNSSESNSNSYDIFLITFTDPFHKPLGLIPIHTFPDPLKSSILGSSKSTVF